MSRTLCSLEIDGREADSLHETAYIDKASYIITVIHSFANIFQLKYNIKN